jgi:hypothetical protein
MFKENGISGPNVEGERDFRFQCRKRTGFQVPMSKENGISGPNVEGERDFRSQCRRRTFYVAKVAIEDSKMQENRR